MEQMENRYYPRYFKLYELLPPEAFTYDDMVSAEKYMQRGWSCLNNRLLITLDVIREILGCPLICNTWFQDGNRKYSGWRPRNCSVGAALSEHKEGRAADLLSPTMTAEQMRQKIIANQDKLPYPIRIEKDVAWLHIDVKDMDYKGNKVYFFKA